MTLAVDRAVKRQPTNKQTIVCIFIIFKSALIVPLLNFIQNIGCYPIWLNIMFNSVRFDRGMLVNSFNKKPNTRHQACYLHFLTFLFQTRELLTDPVRMHFHQIFWKNGILSIYVNFFSSYIDTFWIQNTNFNIVGKYNNLTISYV